VFWPVFCRKTLENLEKTSLIRSITRPHAGLRALTQVVISLFSADLSLSNCRKGARGPAVSPAAFVRLAGLLRTNLSLHLQPSDRPGITTVWPPLCCAVQTPAAQCCVITGVWDGATASWVPFWLAVSDLRRAVGDAVDHL